MTKQKTTIVTKISTKTVYGIVDIAALKEKKTLPIMRVYGIAKRIITGTTNFGDYIGFGGAFEAVNKDTGELFVAGKCFLPDVAANMLSGEFAKDIESIRFAFNIDVKYREDLACKYEYVVNPLIKSAEDNPIALLRGEVDKTTAPEKTKK